MPITLTILRNTKSEDHFKVDKVDAIVLIDKKKSNYRLYNREDVSY